MPPHTDEKSPSFLLTSQGQRVPFLPSPQKCSNAPKVYLKRTSKILRPFLLLQTCVNGPISLPGYYFRQCEELLHMSKATVNTIWTLYQELYKAKGNLKRLLASCIYLYCEFQLLQVVQQYNYIRNSQYLIGWWQS